MKKKKQYVGGSGRIKEKLKHNLAILVLSMESNTFFDQIKSTFARDLLERRRISNVSCLDKPSPSKRRNASGRKYSAAETVSVAKIGYLENK